MANDNLLAGLAGFLGGVESVYVPFKQEELSKRLQFELEKGKRNLEAIPSPRFKQITGLDIGGSPTDVYSPQEAELAVKARTPTYLVSPEGQIKQTFQGGKVLQQKPETSPNVPIYTPEQAGALAQSGTRIEKGSKILPPTFGMQNYASIRGKQFIMQDLPSNQSPSGSTSGAASQVQLAVRQGKGLIAKKGSAQQISLAASDLARAVQRSAPQLDTLREAGFAHNIVTQLSMLSQRYSANPNGPDAPKIRKQMYDIFNELENTSRPVVERQLDAIESIYKETLPPDWKDLRGAQLGENFPEIPFEEGSSTSTFSGGVPQVGQTFQGKKVINVRKIK